MAANHYLKKQQPSWMKGGAAEHNFERDTPRDHLCQDWTLHRGFLPSLAPFGQAVSEEKIFRSVPPTNMAAKGNSCFWWATV
jgi:hypothetical protein